MQIETESEGYWYNKTYSKTTWFFFTVMSNNPSKSTLAKMILF